MSNLHPLLQPYRATVEEPFDARRAAHLLNRAGFGGTPAEIEHVLRLGPQEAVEWLLDFPDASAAEQSNDRPNLSAAQKHPRSFDALAKLFAGKVEKEGRVMRQAIIDANRESMAELGLWWLARMAAARPPLQEKLTLFWHGHFTTSADIEWSVYLLWQQNEMLRRMAAGNFRQLVHAVARDPAMLSYLDNSQNHKEQPNENFARELLELYTLGIGHYSERDVREAARALTGWTHDGERFVYDRADHDDGEKQFLGAAGNFDGGNIVDRAVDHPACARFIAVKLFRFFVTDEVDDELSAGLARAFRDGGMELRPLLRTILTSDAFYREEVINGQYKSPIQLVVGTARLLETNMPREQSLLESLRRMGQAPFFPPDVNGWPGGRSWITTSLLFQRHNVAGALTSLPRGAKPPDALTLTPEETVDWWLARLVSRPLDPTQRRVLLDALGDDPHVPSGVQKLLRLIVTLAEYQVC